MSRNKRLTNLDYQNPEYWHDEPTTAIVPAKRGELVRPLPQPAPVVARRMGPIDINMPQQSILTVDMRTNAVDRATGFNIETRWLATIGGVFAVLIACVGYGHPFMTMGTLLTFGTWFTLVYFAMWLIHRILTPEFIALFNAIVAARLASRRE